MILNDPGAYYSGNNHGSNVDVAQASDGLTYHRIPMQAQTIEDPPVATNRFVMKDSDYSSLGMFRND